MASASSTVKQLDDLTECPICSEVFTDPRVLPCIHTYCLKCIGDWVKEHKPGDAVACPVCRKEFVVPTSGVEELPKNLFVEKLLNIRQLAGSESKSCDVCSTSESCLKPKPATVYCLDCQQKLCDTCQQCHKTFRMFSSHKTVDFKDHHFSRDIYLKYPLAGCERHADKRVELFCFKCNEIICISCYIETHNSHKCSDIGKVGEEFRQQIAADFDKVEAGIGRCGEILRNLSRYKEDFVQQICKAQDEICEKAESLKQVIDQHKMKLVDELTALKETRSQQIEKLSEDIRRHLATMEGLKKYADEVKSKGTACDVVRAVNGLHDRADELLKFDFVERSLAELRHVDISFMPSNFVRMVGDAVVKRGDLLLKDLVEGEITDLRLADMRARDIQRQILSLMSRMLLLLLKMQRKL